MQSRRTALTGGIASGKSTVAGMFAERGGVILDADRAARQVVEPGAPCWKMLRELLGADYFEENGELRRRQLREAIIRDGKLRGQVNAIIHPAIADTMGREWLKWKQTDPGRPVIFDIPLLFEAQLQDRFDTIILAYVPPEIQIQRLMARDKVTRAQAVGALSMQMDIESKRKQAHIVVDNSGDLENTRRQVHAIWERLLRDLK